MAKTARDEADEAEISALEAEEQFEQLKDWFQLDDEHSAGWRLQAYKDFDFYAGRQWDEQDRATLEAQKRPVITFNRVLSIIKSVCGLEINSRHDTIYLPREDTNTEEVRANEILSAASRWMADGCDAEDEQSEAFQDTVICGMGWTESIVDFDEDPEGAYVEKKLDPLEMRWDRNARAKNLSDAKRKWRARKMRVKDALQMFPGHDAEDLDASSWVTSDPDSTKEGKSREEKRKRHENMTFHDDRAEIIVVHGQWIEMEEYYRCAHPKMGLNGMGMPQVVGFEEVELSPDEFKTYKAEAESASLPVKSAKMRRKVYKQAFLGGKILGKVEPGPAGNAFSWNCITGERDPNEGIWFGLVSIMRDPQMWANKWLSQTLHILNSTAKGGILAERSAFKDVREAQQTYAKPDAITIVENGAIADGKIMQKPGTGIAAPYVQLMEFAISSIRDVPGINLELLGMRDANQPGILEHQRKQAGMTILATLFDSLRRFRKRVGRVRLFYIQEYFSDGRLIRVAGPDGRKFMRLIEDKTTGKYDVEIDDAPTSPNQREVNWGIIQQLFPVFKELLTPEAVAMLLEYSPLPAQVVESFKKMVSEPKPGADEEHALAVAGEKTKIAAVQAQADKDRSTAGKNRAAAILDLATAYAKGAEARKNEAQAVKTTHETSMDELLAQIHELASQGATGPLEEPQSGIPQLPQVPTYVQPRSPAPSVADLIGDMPIGDQSQPPS